MQEARLETAPTTDRGAVKNRAYQWEGSAHNSHGRQASVGARSKRASHSRIHPEEPIGNHLWTT